MLRAAVLLDLSLRGNLADADGKVLVMRVLTTLTAVRPSKSWIPTMSR